MSSSEDDVFGNGPSEGRRSATSFDSEGRLDVLDEVEYANCQMTQLPCFHDAISRTKAEKLLENSLEGSYLIRDSKEKGNYSISVKSTNVVRHFKIVRDNEQYSFGRALFWSPLEIWKHLQEQPVLEIDEGSIVQFMHPYLNECKTSMSCNEGEHAEYPQIGRHYIPDRMLRCPNPKVSKKNSGDTSNRRISSCSIVTSMEGQLYKKKAGKTWKCRWCILKEHSFSYKKNEKNSRPIKSLDLRTALQVADDYEEPAMKNCFRIIFPDIYYIFSSNTEEDKKIWLESIQEQMGTNKNGSGDQ